MQISKFNLQHPNNTHEQNFGIRLEKTPKFTQVVTSRGLPLFNSRILDGIKATADNFTNIADVIVLDAKIKWLDFLDRILIVNRTKGVQTGFTRLENASDAMEKVITPVGAIKKSFPNVCFTQSAEEELARNMGKYVTDIDDIHSMLAKLNLFKKDATIHIDVTPSTEKCPEIRFMVDSGQEEKTYVYNKRTRKKILAAVKQDAINRETNELRAKCDKIFA